METINIRLLGKRSRDLFLVCPGNGRKILESKGDCDFGKQTIKVAHTLTSPEIPSLKQEKVTGRCRILNNLEDKSLTNISIS